VCGGRGGIGEVGTMLNHVPRIGQRIKVREIRGTITALIPASVGYARAYEARLDNGAMVVGSKHQFDPIVKVRSEVRK
jgi:hypothetical protein